MSNNTSRSESGGNRSQSNNNRNRSGNRNRGGSNRGGGGSNRGGGGGNRSRSRSRDDFRGDPSSRPPSGGSSQGRFVKQKVPRRTKPPTLWEKFIGLFGFGPTKRKAPPQRAGAAQGNSSSPRPQNDEARSRPTAKSPQKSRSSDNSRGREERPREKRPPEKVEVTGPRLYVGNLSYDTGEDDLKKLFSEVGEVASAEVVCHQRNQRSKGYAFVQMADIDAAKRAVETIHDREFMGRPVLVSGAKSAGPKTREEA
jgi:hypothetical protein